MLIIAIFYPHTDIYIYIYILKININTLANMIKPYSQEVCIWYCKLLNYAQVINKKET